MRSRLWQIFRIAARHRLDVAVPTELLTASDVPPLRPLGPTGLAGALAAGAAPGVGGAPSVGL